MSNSNNIYNILHKLKSITDTAALTPDLPTTTTPLYESVQPRGSIAEAVSSLESKYNTFKESAKPDFLDVDKDGNKKEPFKKAVKDKKVSEGAIDDLRDRQAEKKEADADKYKATRGEKKDVKRTVAGKSYGGSKSKDEDEKDELDEGREFKSKADFDSSAKPGDYYHTSKGRVTKTATGVKHERSASKEELDESFEDKLELAREKAAAKGLTKNKAKDNEANVRLVKGKQYGGSAQKDAAEKEELDESSDEAKLERYHELIKLGMDPDDAEVEVFNNEDSEELNEYSEEEYNQAIGAFKAKGGRVQQLPLGSAKNPISTASRHIAGRGEAGKGKPAGRGAKVDGSGKPVVDVYEKAPPGAKAERMVKQVKQGYANDGKLTKREKGIAYATAWKAHNKGQVEEGTEFKDTIKNSAAKLSKAPKAKLKESVDLRKHPIYTTQEAWDHYAKELAEQETMENMSQSNIPSPTNAMPVTHELDEIARLAGLPVRETNAGSNMVTLNGKAVDVHSIEVDGIDPADSPDYSDAYISYAEYLDGTPLTDNEMDQLRNEHGELVNQAAHGSMQGAGDFLDEEDDDFPAPPPEKNYVLEKEMAEGNEFSGALAAAKASGAKEFEVDGKRYTVKEDVTLMATGDDDVVNLIRKLAGMEQVETIPAETEIEYQPVDDEMGIEEERDIEHANTPNEKIAPIGAAIPSGDDLHRAKDSYSDKPFRGDNPMSVRETVEDSLWKKYSGMLQSLLK